MPPPPSASGSPGTIGSAEVQQRVALLNAAAGDAGEPIGVGKHPTPEAVCDHLFELATASEGPSGAMLALGTREQCIEHQRRENLLGETSSCQFNVCSMRSKTWSEVKRCSKQSSGEQDPTGNCDRHSLP